MAATNLPDGITNANVETVFGQMMFPDPTLFHTYFNDFDTYVAGDWVVTETDSAATQALTAGNNGLLLLTNTATENDLLLLQKTPAAFAMTAGKKAWFSIRFQSNDVDENDYIAGLVIVDTTPFDATDGIYFQSDDGSSSVSIICRKNATTGSTSAVVGTIADATNVALQWYYDGAGKLYYGKDGTPVGVIDVANYLPDATNLTVTFGIQAGEAAANTMTVDYVLAAVER